MKETKMNLCSPAEIRRLLDKYSLGAKKCFGQNFLTNPLIPEKIAQAAKDASNLYCDNNQTSSVLEIGPGIGSMTTVLCELFSNVAAVEIDRGLIPLLNEVMAEYKNFSLINCDFMELELPEFFCEHFPEGNVAICANLPYYITTPIIMKILESWPASAKSPVNSITIMIQNEVANRLTASPSSKDYGAISVSLRLWGTAKKLFTVSPGCFYPAPKVSSAVVQIIPHTNGIKDIFGSISEVENPEKFIDNVKNNITAAFGMRRKTLVNSMSSRYHKSNIENALLRMGYPIDIRGEKLSAEDFCQLTLYLNQFTVNLKS